MSENKINSFPPEVVAELKDYVYRLIDPRNGETFYVGRGVGNRVFDHANGVFVPAEGDSESASDPASEKIDRILKIKLANLEVGHVIHRYGLEKEEARIVEAALIDAYPGLTNIQGGYGSGDFGPMHPSEIVSKYSAKIAEFKHKALLISVNKSTADTQLLQATQFAWRLNKSKAESAEVILATVQGLIKGAFVAEKWLEATSANFPGRETIEGRYGFYGKEAPIEINNMYKDKRVPDQFRKKGASNPIKYTW